MSYTTDRLDETVFELLKGGGVGLLPSDTIYGLSGRALEPKAVEKLHMLKERDENKPFIVLISNTKMLDLLSINPKMAAIVKKYWPGALSVVFPAAGAPAWLSRGTDTLAVRWPDYPDLNNLIDSTGPLISTSANLQGHNPVHSAAEALNVFGGKLDFYVDIGRMDNPPSTLAVLSGDKLRVIRQGAVRINKEDQR